MGVLGLVFLGIIAFIIAYRFYGGYLEHQVLKCDPDATCPAHALRDEQDYVPASAPVLLGHHFASISGAGPITGPIIAAAFGWVPVALWIILGSIFFGGVHDYTSLMASARHDGKSMGEVIKANIGPRAQALFLVFVWLALILVLAAFGILIRDSFVGEPAIATTAVGFIVLALVFGYAVYRMRVPMVPATIVGVVLLVGAIFLGIQAPLVVDPTVWIYILFAYCFIASITPVWILLQPRDYLNSFILYALLIGAALGILVGQPSLELPAYTGFTAAPGLLFPMLFVTVACGAISGFHSVVSSGTTSKQLNNERDGRIIGYGGMLIEGVLALIALSTAAIFTLEGYGDIIAVGPPLVFAEGVGGFLEHIGIPLTVGVVFGGLALNAFMLTTLDTATRLSRYAFSELFENRIPGLSNRYVATLVSVLAGGGLALSGEWATIWPIFGSSNQLLAGLALLAGSVWLMRRQTNALPTLVPMVFMLAVTLTALVFLIQDNLAVANYILGIPGIILFILAIFLIIEAYTAIKGMQETSRSGVS